MTLLAAKINMLISLGCISLSFDKPYQASTVTITTMSQDEIHTWPDLLSPSSKLEAEAKDLREMADKKKSESRKLQRCQKIADEVQEMLK